MPLSNYLPPSRLIQPGVCTSTTLPAAPYNGQVIYETDTGKTKVWNGSAWIVIANTTGGGSNRRLDYQTRTTTYTVSSGTFSGASDIFSTNLSFTANGTSTYWIEFYSTFAYTGYTGVDSAVSIYLTDGSGADLGRCFVSPKNNVDGARTYSGVCFKVPYTPSSGTKTINFRAFLSSGSTTTSGGISAGAGGAGNDMPMFMAVYGPALT